MRPKQQPRQLDAAARLQLHLEGANSIVPFEHQSTSADTDHPVLPALLNTNDNTLPASDKNGRKRKSSAAGRVSNPPPPYLCLPAHSKLSILNSVSIPISTKSALKTTKLAEIEIGQIRKIENLNRDQLESNATPDKKKKSYTKGSTESVWLIVSTECEQVHFLHKEQLALCELSVTPNIVRLLTLVSSLTNKTELFVDEPSSLSEGQILNLTIGVSSTLICENVLNWNCKSNFNSQVRTRVKELLLLINPDLDCRDSIGNQSDENANNYRNRDNPGGPGRARREDVSELLHNIRSVRLQSVSDNKQKEPLSLPDVCLTQLRPYQCEAVQWMLHRETHGTRDLYQSWLNDWLSVTDTLYMHKSTCVFITINQYNELKTANTVYGGILADEMGLGKTVEVLSLVLMHRRQETSFDQKDDANPSTSAIGSNVDTIKESAKRTKKSTILSPEDVKLNDVSKSTCSCARPTSLKKSRVLCTDCDSWQHMKCVTWTTTDTVQNYLCPACLMKQDILVSGATLVISPESIAEQWLHETHKHIKPGALKVYIYRGLRATGRFVQPSFLAQQDIVIVSYETLRNELVHATRDTGKSFRYTKRYTSAPSPLTCIDWWRMCVDEAQLVETVSGKAAQMCSLLCARNRWAVTGTPINKSAQELYGLMVLLGVSPFYNVSWWRQLVFDRYMDDSDRRPLHRLMAELMWRNEKCHVNNQLALPSMTSSIKWLQFSPIEEHFYSRLLEKCNTQIQGVLNKWAANWTDWNEHLPLTELSHTHLVQLMTPLLQVRQCCVHPQVTGANKTDHINKKVMSMDDVLQRMVKDTKHQCTAQHRCMVFAQNGLAGLSWLSQDYEAAVNYYKQVLKSSADYVDRFDTDKLQRIHAMHNLIQLLSAQPHLSSLVDSKEDWQTECTKLCTAYLAQSKSNLSLHIQQCMDFTLNTRHLIESCALHMAWLSDLVSVLRSHGLDAQFVQMVQTHVLTHTQQSTTETHNAFNFHTSHGLCYSLSEHWQSLCAARRKVLTIMHRLNERLPFDDPSFVLNCAECHLRPTVANQALHTCFLCVIDATLKKYEDKLFNPWLDSRKGNNEPDADEGAAEGASWQSKTRKVNKGPTRFEYTLTAIASCARSLRANHSKTLAATKELLPQATSQLKLIVQLKSEFNLLRQVFLSAGDSIKFRDELEMSKMRMSLLTGADERTENVVVPALVNTQQTYTRPVNLVAKHEIQTNSLQLQVDLQGAQRALDRHLAHLKYLAHLDQSQKGQALGDCRICMQPIGERWVLLKCGHYFCEHCNILQLQRLVHNEQRLKCAMCRELTHRAQISYVSAKLSNQSALSCNVSTKVDAIVQCIQSVTQNGSTKCLVFSTWDSVLRLVGTALSRLNINHQHFAHKGSLHTFKTDTECNVLLLRVTSGARGLNLTEAQHVLFCEPLMEPAALAQAIGRVHRIGQTLNTYVHHFLIGDSVEQRIHELMGDKNSHLQIQPSHDVASTSSAPDNHPITANTALTINQIRNLLIHSNAN